MKLFLKNDFAENTFQLLAHTEICEGSGNCGGDPNDTSSNGFGDYSSDRSDDGSDKYFGGDFGGEKQRVHTRRKLGTVGQEGAIQTCKIVYKNKRGKPFYIA